MSLVLEQVDLGMDAVRIDEVQAVERTEAADLRVGGTGAVVLDEQPVADLGRR